MSTGNNVLCLIYNHNNNENSEAWLNRLVVAGYDAYILDSGSDKPLDYKRVIKFDNIYWGGLFDQSLKLFYEKKADWLFFVCDDIIIDDENFTKLTKSIEIVVSSSSMGIYQPSTIEGESHNVWSKNNNKGTGQLRLTSNIEGWMMLVRKPIVDVMNNLFVNYSNDMKMGWGTDVLMSYFSMKKGFLNIVDDSVVVKHPKGGAKYNTGLANQQMNEVFSKMGTSFQEIVEDCNRLYNLIISRIVAERNKKQ